MTQSQRRRKVLPRREAVIQALESPTTLAALGDDAIAAVMDKQSDYD